MLILQLITMSLTRRSRQGKLHLIFGPMYAGKTTELIRLKDRAENAGKKTIAIKYYKDVRYDNQQLSTHDKIKRSAICSHGSSLKKTIESIIDIEQYDCFFIDEIQFYEDGAEVSDNLANLGYEVVVCGLQGDFKRQTFKVIADLIGLADQFTHLTAIDRETGNEASFTARFSGEIEQEVIGGEDKYIATDRDHYLKINK